MTDTLVIRRADIQDAPRLTELFELVYRKSSHPLQNFRDVAAFLDNPLNFAVVAELDERAVALTAMTYTAWNDSYELGRALSDPEWRRQGFAALLMHRALGEVRERSLGQLFYGYPRVRRTADLCETTIPPFIVAGHDAGRNVVNSLRETRCCCETVGKD